MITASTSSFTAKWALWCRSAGLFESMQHIYDALDLQLLCLSFIDITTAMSVALPGSCRVKTSVACRLGTAALASLPHRLGALSGSWTSDVRWLAEVHGQQILCDGWNVSIIIERETARWVENFLLDTEDSSLHLSRTIYKADRLVHQHFGCLSIVKCYPDRRLISRSRCGCHGFYVGYMLLWQR